MSATRSKSWNRWDELDKALRPLKEKYAAKAAMIAHQHFGDKMFSDATIHLALQEVMGVALEVAFARLKLQCRKKFAGKAGK